MLSGCLHTFGKMLTLIPYFSLEIWGTISAQLVIVPKGTASGLKSELHISAQKLGAQIKIWETHLQNSHLLNSF